VVGISRWWVLSAAASGLDLDCVEEVGELAGCYALDGIVLLVVAEVETRYLVRFE